MKITHVVRKLVLTVALVALAAPAVALAEARVSIQLGLPAVLPPLVVVEPGVQVVQDYDQEIFFVDGYYWVRRDGYWYRARHHRDRWVYVEPAYVPGALVRIPPGHYRHWHGGGWKGQGRGWKAGRPEWKERREHGGRGHDDR
jgi:hypothetical protein